MWCPKCQAEVAAEATTSDWRLLCTTCGTEVRRQPGDLSGPAVAPAVEATRVSRHPRELLARWAEEDATDPLGPPRPIVPLTRTGLGGTASHGEPTPPMPPELSTALWSEGRAISKKSAGDAPAAPPAETSRGSAVATGSGGPAFRLPRRNDPTARPRSESGESGSVTDRWMPLMGQMFAYLGVVTLFVGSVLVLLGYFGGIAAYAPTGWIIATAGQMLMFLGVVTLISAGLQQTSDTVRESLEDCSRRLARLESEVASLTPDSSAPESPSRSERIARLEDELARLRAA